MSNTLTEVTPKLLAQGLMALRANTIMPRLVNRDYDTMAAQKGETINVPIPSAVAAQDVTPANTPPATADSSPTSVPIPLDQWKEAPFYMTDKDMKQAMAGVIPMQASEAINSLADTVDTYIMNLYKSVYGYVGTAGTTPFASTTVDATNTRKTLWNQRAPGQNRRFVLDPDAEANALNLRAFQDMSFSGSNAAVVDAELNRKIGFQWFMDQNIVTHTKGTLSGTTGAGQALIDNAAVAIGDVTIDLDDTSLTGTIVAGDIFTVAGDTQTYVCKATVTAATNAITGMTFAPAAKVAWANNAELTLKASHVVNQGFHRDCYAFATRPLEDEGNGLGNIIQSAVDPISGLSLRIEVSREHKRVRWSYDILYGGACIRPELGCRLAG